MSKLLQVGAWFILAAFFKSVPSQEPGSPLLAVHAGERTVFQSPVDIAAGGVHGVSSLDAADIDGDGLVDVAVIEGGKHAKAKTFAWFRAPAGSAGRWERSEFNTAAPLKTFLGAARLVDIDSDGDEDLVVSSDMHSGDIKEADVFVFLNPLPGGDVHGRWRYIEVARRLPYHHINDMEVIDMDGDGRTDIVARSLEPNEIHVFFQNTPELWDRKSIPTNLSQSEGLAVGDLDGDGMPDVTFTGFALVAPQLPRKQDYELVAIDPGYHLVNQNTKECIGDIDGDGRPDVLIAPAEAYRSGKNHVLAWYGNPGGDISRPWRKHVVVGDTNDMHTVKLALIDADKHLDIVAGVAWGNQSVAIYYNSGNGSFREKQVLAEGKGLYSGVVADFGDDGDMDILGQDTYAGDSKPWLYESLREN